MVETVSHTDYHTYNVSSYAGGSVTINIDSIIHNDKNAWDYTIGVYFQDINGNPVYQPTEVGTTWAMPTDLYDKFNQVVIIPELLAPRDGGVALSNLSFNVDVPNGATEMFWFVWRNAGPSDTNNYNWDLISGDKFLVVDQAEQYAESHAGYLKYSYSTRTYYQPDGITIAKNNHVRVRGRNISGSVSNDTSINFSSNPDATSLIYQIFTDPSVTGGKIYHGNELFVMTGIEVLGTPYVNQGPTVVVPGDVTVGEQTNVVLSASGSFDPDGDNLTYQWTQTAGPSVSIINATSAVANFVTEPMHWNDPDILYTFIVGVSDGINPTEYGTINVTATADANSAPVTQAVVNELVNGGETVTFVDSSTYDPDGDSLSFVWTQISGPTVGITNPAARNVEVTFPTVPYGHPNYVILRATITDSGGLSTTRELRITITVDTNQGPTAIATADQDNPAVNTLVTLSGDQSSDPEGGVLTYSWTGISSTDGTIPELSDYTAVSPTFTSTAIAEGGSDVVIVYRLTVTDNGGLSAYDDVVITVAAPVATQEPVAEPTVPACDRCNICYAITTNATSVFVNGSATSNEAVTYDPFTGKIVNDGTVVMPTVSYSDDGGITTKTGYLGDSNIIFASRVQVSARTKVDLETYGYSYQLLTSTLRSVESSVANS